MRNNLLLAFLLLSFHAITAQNVTGRVTDSKTGKNIPYASVRINDSQNLITNAEGFFTFPEKENNESTLLTVSYLGYASRTLTIAELKKLQSAIALQPGYLELEAVKVENIDPYKILERVNRNLRSNYGFENESLPLKNVVFYRETKVVKPEKLDFKMTKSTRLTEEQIKSENERLKEVTSKLISYPPQEYRDNLCNYYTNETTGKTADGKWKYINPKLDVVKAVKIGGAQSWSLDDLKEGGIGILKKHLDSTKYYKVGSGIAELGNDSVSSKHGSFKKYDRKKKDLIQSKRFGLMSFISSNKPQALSGYELNFLQEPEQYYYTYEGSTYSDENDLVYVLNFKPRKSKAKFNGKLYVSEKDYAVIRIDYDLAEGETTDGLNLKLLFGFKFSDNEAKGTLIYKHNPYGNGYYLHYASVESGEQIYVNRPLQFTELNRKKKNKNKDVVAFDVKTEFNIVEKTEYLNISREPITQEDFEKVKEEEFDYVKVKHYDPKIWKGLSVIEPLEEMKQYQASDKLD